jgi:mono/diheme cytochrome c family protein
MQGHRRRMRKGVIELALLVCFSVEATGPSPNISAQTKLANPIAATPASIAAGQTAYHIRCASCHGETGKGDGKAGSRGMDPKPANLTDAVWKHGSSDAEIYAVVSDGVPNTGMVAFSKKGMTPDDIWNVVNYVKSLRKR